jgi:hypothetical protein
MLRRASYNRRPGEIEVSSARFDGCRANQSHRGHRLAINDSFFKGNLMKKLLLASLSVASVAMLAGCEKPAPAPAPPPAAATPAPAPAPPPAEPATPAPAGGEMKKEEKK